MRDAGVANALDERLALAGISDDEVRRKSRMFARASAALARRPTLRLWVPGRIEFLGKHTDYAGGRSLVCTVERGFVVVAAARDDRLVRIIDAVSSEQVEIVCRAEIKSRTKFANNCLVGIEFLPEGGIEEHLPSVRRYVEERVAALQERNASMVQRKAG